MAEKKNVHKDHRSRMRNKFSKKKFDGWEEHEILEMLLFYAIPRVNTNPIAHRLIDTFGCLSNVLDASVEDLQNVEGVGQSAAVYLKALGEVPGVYRRSKWVDNRKNLSSVANMSNFCIDYLDNELEEVFAVITLDSQYNLKNKEIISRGLVNFVPVSIRKIAEIALRTNASYVVLCHNHPSGLPTPSREDIELTKDVISALSPLNVELIDHVVVGGGTYYSLAQHGYLNN